MYWHLRKQKWICVLFCCILFVDEGMSRLGRWLHLFCKSVPREGGRKHYRLPEGERRGRRMSESKRKVCSITVGSRRQWEEPTPDTAMPLQWQKLSSDKRQQCSAYKLRNAKVYKMSANLLHTKTYTSNMKHAGTG